MQEARTLVPSFGNWDTGTEIPYTTVFEKVRATKDGKPISSSQTPSRHQQLQGNPSSIYPQYDSDKYSNASSELQRGKRSVLDEWGTQMKRTADVQSSSSRRSSLEQIADHIFTESQHAAGNDSPVISRQSTSSNTSWQGNQYVGSRELREPYLKETTYMHNQGVFPNGHNQGYQAYGSRVPGPITSPRRERRLPHEPLGSHSLYPTPGKQSNQQQLFQANQRSAEIPSEKALPKFGDWDAMDPTKVEFTVIFDKARNERKCSINQEYSLKDTTNHEVDEVDLYKPSSRRRNGLWTLICCIRPHVS